MLFLTFIVWRITVELYTKFVKKNLITEEKCIDVSSLLAANVNNVADVGNLRY